MGESKSNDGEGARPERKIQVVTETGDFIFEVKIPIIPSEPLEPEAKAPDEEWPTGFSPSRAELQSDTWDREQAIREFRNLIEGGADRTPLDDAACVRALDRLDCWQEAIEQFLHIPGPNERIGRNLLRVWIHRGLSHIAPSLKGDLVLFVDVLKRLLPPYTGAGLTLYRGELRSRHASGIYGIAWTPRIEAARTFAVRRVPLGEGPGVVLQIEAKPEMIIAGPIDGLPEEREYLVDPRLIQPLRVIE